MNLRTIAALTTVGLLVGCSGVEVPKQFFAPPTPNAEAAQALVGDPQLGKLVPVEVKDQELNQFMQEFSKIIGRQVWLADLSVSSWVPIIKQPRFSGLTFVVDTEGETDTLSFQDLCWRATLVPTDKPIEVLTLPLVKTAAITERDGLRNLPKQTLQKGDPQKTLLLAVRENNYPVLKLMQYQKPDSFGMVGSVLELREVTAFEKPKLPIPWEDAGVAKHWLLQIDYSVR